MKKLLTIDHLLFGIAAGIVVSGLSFGLVQLVISLLPTVPAWLSIQKTPYFLAFVPTLVLFRYFMVSKKMDKTGRGVLLVAFAGILAVFFIV